MQARLLKYFTCSAPQKCRPSSRPGQISRRRVLCGAGVVVGSVATFALITQYNEFSSPASPTYMIQSTADQDRKATFSRVSLTHCTTYSSRMSLEIIIKTNHSGPKAGLSTQGVDDMLFSFRPEMEDLIEYAARRPGPASLKQEIKHAMQNFVPQAGKTTMLGYKVSPPHRDWRCLTGRPSHTPFSVIAATPNDNYALPAPPTLRGTVPLRGATPRAKMDHF